MMNGVIPQVELVLYITDLSFLSFILYSNVVLIVGQYPMH